MLLVPVLVFFAVWNILPLVWMLGLSFYRYFLTFGQPAAFFGLQNYVQILQDFSQWQSFGVTFMFMVASVALETVLGVVLGLAFWGSQRLPGRRVALTMLFTPMILAPVAVGTFFQLILDPEFGIIPYYWKLMFGTSIDLLGNGATALPAVIGVDIWMWTPFMILMTLAALGAVPKSAMEAADVDRLTWLQKLRYAVWPYGRFILVLGVLLRTIDAFKTFGLIYSMTSGGPGNATETLSISLYRQAFNNFAMGSASALALISLFVAIAFTSLYLYVLRTRVAGEAA